MPLKSYLDDQVTNFFVFNPMFLLMTWLFWTSLLVPGQSEGTWPWWGLEYKEAPLFFLPAPPNSVSSEEGSAIKKTFTWKSYYMHLLFSSPESNYELFEKGCPWLQYFCVSPPAAVAMEAPVQATLQWDSKSLTVLRPLLDNSANPNTISQSMLEFALWMFNT